MKQIDRDDDFSIQECLDAIREECKTCDFNASRVWLLADRIEELTRWIPVSERLPTKGDANFHDEVMVSLDPMSIVNSPFGMMGIETVEYTDVCESKHTHWKRTTEPKL